MSQSDKVWAYCPNCKHTTRFLRFEVNHWLHAQLTVLTLGLWGISWAALAIGQRLRPLHCNQCGWNEPDLTKKIKSRSKNEEAQAAPGTEPDALGK